MSALFADVLLTNGSNVHWPEPTIEELAARAKLIALVADAYRPQREMMERAVMIVLGRGYRLDECRIDVCGNTERLVVCDQPVVEVTVELAHGDDHSVKVTTIPKVIAWPPRRACEGVPGGFTNDETDGG